VIELSAEYITGPGRLVTRPTHVQQINNRFARALFPQPKPRNNSLVDVFEA